jgi:hypothetical protein
MGLVHVEQAFAEERDRSGDSPAFDRGIAPRAMEPKDQQRLRDTFQRLQALPVEEQQRLLDRALSDMPE